MELHKWIMELHNFHFFPFGTPYISTLQTLADRYTMHMHVQLISSLPCLVSWDHQFFSCALLSPHENAVVPCWAILIRQFSAHWVLYIHFNSSVNTIPMCCFYIPYLGEPSELAHGYSALESIFKENSSACPPCCRGRAESANTHGPMPSLVLQEAK